MDAGGGEERWGREEEEDEDAPGLTRGAARLGMLEAGRTSPHGIGEKGTSACLIPGCIFGMEDQCCGCPVLLLHQQRDATSTGLADVAPELLDPEIKGWGAVGSPLGLQPHLTPCVSVISESQRGLGWKGP